MWTSRLFISVAVVSALMACADRPTILHQTLAGADTLATTADARLVYSRNVELNPQTGQIVPRQVVYAEPSPDVAKAFSQAFSMCAEADAKALPALSTAGDVSGSAAFLHSRSEAIAQLGKRLGTFQLVVELVAGDGAPAPENANTTAYASQGGVGLGATPTGASAPDAASNPKVGGAPVAAKKVALVASGAGGNPGADQTPTNHASIIGTTTSQQLKSASVSDAQAAAVVSLQQAFQRGSEGAPLVLAGSAALDHETVMAAPAGAAGTSSTSSSPLVSICKDF